ncbi:TolC family protein [Candidatus Neomarinimicrobiota bacterium]
MSRKIHSILFIVIVALSVIPVQSQELVLDFTAAKELALKNNPKMHLSQAALAISKTRISEARSALLPTIDAFSQYQRAWELPTVIFEDPFSDGVIEFKMGTEHTLVYGVNLQQPLFAGGAIWSSYQIARHGYNIAQAQLTATHQNLILNVATSYYATLFSRSVVRVMEEALETAQENLEQVQKIRAVGQSSDFDVLRAEVGVANFRPLLISARNNYRLARSQLKQVLGIDGNPDIKINEKLIYTKNEFSNINIEDLMIIALNSRPEMKILDEQKLISKRQLVLARSALMPNLIFGTAYQYQGQKEKFEFGNDDFYKSFNSSISFNFPLFHGLQTRARVQKAKINIRETDLQEKTLTDGLRLEVESAYYTIQETEQNVQTQMKIIDQATEALRLARLLYAEGAGTQLDVMNAESALNQTKMNYQQSLFEYNIALAKLKKALNQL